LRAIAEREAALMLTSEGMKTLRQESFFKENRITKVDLNQSSPKIMQQYLAEVNCNGDEEKFAKHKGHQISHMKHLVSK
jgi:hypothetical protein